MMEPLAGDGFARLAAAICGRESDAGTDDRSAARALYRLLGDGQPVSPARLAAALGWEVDRSRRLLDGLANVELDEESAVVGYGGLSLRPTPHRFTIAGQTRYAWCAWDTLFLPVALGTEIAVASTCPCSGSPVTLRVAPTGVLERHPESVVLSFLAPGSVDAEDLRGSFCGQVHFLADASTATRWLAERDHGLVLDLDDAFELGRRMIRERCGA